MSTTMGSAAGGMLADAAAPKLYRRPDRGWIGGVATGIGAHLHVRPRFIRVAFLALAVAGGLGVALYGAYWIVLPTAPGAKKGRLPVWLEYVLGLVAVIAAVGSVIGRLPAGGLFLPTLLACLGGALIWRQATDIDRARMRRLSRNSLASSSSPAAFGGDSIGRLRLAVGASFVLAGGALVLAKADFTAVRDGLLAMIVTVVGLALLTGPWWLGLVSQLGSERSERIRSQERADIAAHLHDSVLQTLALIQRNAASPREVARLARGQERELRTLLYGNRAASGQLTEALSRAAAEVEDGYAVSVDVVFVGDIALTDDLNAAVAAAREAMVNAAKHSGVTAISLYAEVDTDPASGSGSTSVEIFVRDRGSGFDPADIAEDRQGVKGSIVDRVERHGGKATVTSSAGSGTEVSIRMSL